MTRSALLAMDSAAPLHAAQRSPVTRAINRGTVAGHVDHLLHRRVRHAEGLRDAGVGDPARHDVDAAAQRGVVPQRAAAGRGRPAPARTDRWRWSARRSRCAARSPGMLVTAVVDDAVPRCRSARPMRGRPRGLDAAALVDRDVDDRRARPHASAPSCGVTRRGALAPAISTVPITRSAPRTSSSMLARFDISVVRCPPRMSCR